MKWRINFSIINSNYNLVGHAANQFFRNIPKKDGQQLFTEWYLEHKDGRVTAYVPVTVIRDVANWIKDKIITEPEWAEKLHQETEAINWEYFNYAKSLLVKNLEILSNEELFGIYEKLRALQMESHVKAISTTWFLESDDEVYSVYLRERLKKHLQSLGVDDLVKVIEYFTILTTPSKENFSQQEELDFLELVGRVEKENLNLDAKPIKEYYNKWKWTPYGYIGPVYTLEYYQNKIKESLGKIKNLSELIVEEKSRNENLKKQQIVLQQEIKLPEDLQRLFKIAQDIIWLKDFRKYCIWHGHYVLDKITKEISKRLNISHVQANYFFTEEVKNALSVGNFDEHILNERNKYSVIWANEYEQKVCYGSEAHKIIDNLDLEKIEVNLDGGFKGTCAYPGAVTGKVVIVNTIEEVNKVKGEEIMLAVTTYPALLPAMKKAAALVTEDGGITCHAAIVARELKIPCVVGAKKITKFLRDGDMVEVDATNGIIKKV
ncbi:MAG: Phosphoenolpyruvate synthase/pyruvate phosphate dikinase [Candidatus Magasanikbacteria bacterium GW2011_GWA2_37_8]|uniref:Phosphoenolpyruvate synthase/pyruvate phosphate dikinase n=1 Tax=Candidatus Magasanikbacteria bacterium GW2011_GWA2_37_8 TaxID=1619036 RepID=A0A0G0JSV5_9BACT|nr:MAG: Phosphoenolpyruvate synthase/pyruvate phosphate dikinase [Candidatus Magasanikbacteria bacterium GW2011_GWA2_37_8]